jgi:bifunctional UDP-N-acetylglucosamine pyrophosphorylase/glucosamine-1-phosphate N-acetyltransferase
MVNEIDCYILAAGMGTRMNSNLPKVLHKICGLEMVNMVIKVVKKSGIDSLTVVVPKKHQQHKEAIGNSVKFRTQYHRKGTAHALLQAKPDVIGSNITVVLNGDIPLISGKTISRIIQQHRNDGNLLTLATATADNPEGYGRILRKDSGEIARIVEHDEAKKNVLGSITEINAGLYCFSSPWIWNSLEKLKPSSNGEYYLTDLVKLAYDEKKPIGTIMISNEETKGINNKFQLAEVEEIVRNRIRKAVMMSGVTLTDPSSTYIDDNVMVGPDTIVLPNTHITVNTRIGGNCKIGPNTIISESTIGNNCEITSSVVDQSLIRNDVSIGPFSHIRQDCVIDNGVKIGNHTEIKNSHLGKRTKSGHFCYLGDADIGSDVNIGAGTVTCNYDGISKHNTKIGSGAFIGSDTMLVAPIEIGERTVTGAGSVVTKNVPSDSKAVGMPARIIRGGRQTP